MIVIDALIAAYVRVRDREVLKRDKALSVTLAKLEHAEDELLKARIVIDQLANEQRCPTVGADRMKQMFDN